MQSSERYDWVQIEESAQLSPPRKTLRELDRYSPHNVETLLNIDDDWKNIQEIIRITLKELTDVVRVQGDTVRELEKQLAFKASKTELTSALVGKANSADIGRALTEMSSSLEEKLNADDCKHLLGDYVLKADFLEYSADLKTSIKDIRQFLDHRDDTFEVQQEINSLRHKFEDLSSQVNLKLSSYVHQNEIDRIKALLDTKANTDYVNDALENKVNKRVFNDSLHKKANKADVEALLSNRANPAELSSILAALESKADAAVLERVQKKLGTKAERTDYIQLASQIPKLAQREDVDFINAEFERLKLEINKNFSDVDKNIVFLTQNFDNAASGGELTSGGTRTRGLHDRDRKFEVMNERLTHEMHRISEQLSDAFNDRFVDIEDSLHLVKQTIATGRTDMQYSQIREQIEELRFLIEENVSKKVDKKEFLDLKSRILSQVDSKVGLSELIELKAEINSIMRETEKMLFSSVNGRVGGLGTGVMSPKGDSFHSSQRLDRRSGGRSLGSLRPKTLSMDMDGLKFDGDRRGDSDFAVGELKRQIERLRKEVEEKIDTHDVRILLDHKPNRDEVELAVEELHRELDQKVSEERLLKVVDNQAALNESLCSENIIGRWAWKSGEVKSDGLVPWEVQLANTLPGTFIWEKDKPTLIVISAGLYEISLGFFAKKKPLIQVFVNDEPFYTPFNTTSFIKNQGKSLKSKDMNLKKSTTNNHNGLTMVEFIVLPERARITLLYDGESGAEGFFGLKRL